MYPSWRTFWLSLKLLKQEGVLDRKLLRMICCCAMSPKGVLHPRTLSFLKILPGSQHQWKYPAVDPYALNKSPKMLLSSVQCIGTGSQTTALSKSLVVPRCAPEKPSESSCTLFITLLLTLPFSLCSFPQPSAYIFRDEDQSPYFKPDSTGTDCRLLA